MKWTVGSVCAVAAIVVGSGCACRSWCEEDGGGLSPSGDIYRTYGWTDWAAPLTSGVQKVHVAVGGKNYHVEYGPDPQRPGSPDVDAVIIDRGMSWRQNHGYFYLWGHWLVFDTDRTRTITWGTTVCARMLPAEGALLERDQIFVMCGDTVVIPKDLAVAPVRVAQGQYVIVSKSATGGLTVSAPADYPTPDTGADTPEEQDMLDFLTAVQANHPDPCNP